MISDVPTSMTAGICRPSPTPHATRYPYMSNSMSMPGTHLRLCRSWAAWSLAHPDSALTGSARHIAPGTVTQLAIPAQGMPSHVGRQGLFCLQSGGYRGFEGSAHHQSAAGHAVLVQGGLPGAGPHGTQPPMGRLWLCACMEGPCGRKL